MWNVLEFKGPTVSPRLRDLDRLVELGLGIDRQLNEERGRQPLPPLERGEVSFWYLANRLGRRFLQATGQMLGPLVPEGTGVWRCAALLRRVYLVSTAELPVDADSLPLHIVGKEPPATELAVARYVVERPELWQRYNRWLLTLHPTVWEEVRAMARTAGGKFMIDLRPAVEELGLPEVIRQVGLKRIIETVGLKRTIETVGLKHTIEEVGAKRVLEEVGAKRVLEEMGPDWLLDNLTPAQLRELKRRLS